jgi:alpha-beta hydrolase superfamily lysophospholipase
VLDHDELSARYFFPRPDEPSDPWRVEADGAVLVGWRREVHPGARWVLHFHGNGELVTDYLPALADAFAALGVNPAFGEYRGYGGSTGSPNLPDLLEDAEATFAGLGVPASRVVVFGRSIGSLCALEIASRHPDLGGVIIESGIADMLERILMRVTPEQIGMTEDELVEELARRYDHEAKLGAYAGPLLVLHAEADSMVDASHAERLHRWSAADEATKRLVLLPEGDHNDIFSANREQYWQEVRDFFARLP